MIVLKRLRGEVTRELGRGVRVTLRRLTTIEHETARLYSVGAARALAQGREVLADYGLDSLDGEGRRADLTDPGQRVGLAALLGVVELARLAVVSWEGVALEDGAPAPVTRETLALLCLDPEFYRRLAGALDEVAQVLAVEGNGFGLSGSGSSTPTEGPATAAAAPPETSPAPGESAA